MAHMVYTFGPEGFHITTLRPTYIPHSYMGPLGRIPKATQI